MYRGVNSPERAPLAGELPSALFSHGTCTVNRLVHLRSWLTREPEPLSLRLLHSVCFILQACNGSDTECDENGWINRSEGTWIMSVGLLLVRFNGVLRDYQEQRVQMWHLSWNAAQEPAGKAPQAWGSVKGSSLKVSAPVHSYMDVLRDSCVGKPPGRARGRTDSKKRKPWLFYQVIFFKL